MKNKIIGLVITGLAVVSIIATVGGWLESSDNEESLGTGGGSTPIIQTGVEVMPLSEFNTDKPFENLTIKIVDYVGETMVYEIVNNSNVCYEQIKGETYFKSEPLPGRLPLRENQEYSQFFSFYNIPAYSTTYHMKQSFSEEMSIDKGASFDGVVYYPFEFGVDPYRIEINTDSSSEWFGSKVSETLIQDAREYIKVDPYCYDETTNKIAFIANTTNHTIKYDAFVRFANGYIIPLQNGNDLIEFYEYQYRDILIPVGEEVITELVTCHFETCESEDYSQCHIPCDTENISVDFNTLYTDPYDFENSIMSYDVIIANAYFIGEVDWENERY